MRWTSIMNGSGIVGMTVTIASSPFVLISQFGVVREEVATDVASCQPDARKDRAPVPIETSFCFLQTSCSLEMCLWLSLCNVHLCFFLEYAPRTVLPLPS